ncbi:MAG: SDR family oxidoreductase [Pelagibacterales bacterium]|nr:SDR family oxidoreductase [Pelagibacterales bacterium]
MIVEANKKAALITGGAKRIGKEIALSLASQGYDIVISYNKSDFDAKNLAEKIIKNFSVKCEIFSCNLQDEKEAQDLIKFAIQKFPYLNLLINNASIFNKSKFLEENISKFKENLNIHLISPLFLSKIFAQHVINNKTVDAQIINMVDKNIVRFDTSYFYYLMSKKFLAEFTKMLSLELAPFIRVNAIAPGFILNSVNEENPSLETQNLIKKIPLKKQGDVKNILETVQFLLSNNFVTGQILFIDGGASLNHAG